MAYYIEYSTPFYYFLLGNKNLVMLKKSLNAMLLTVILFTQSSCQSGSNATATENNVNEKHPQNPMKLEAIKVANTKFV